MSALEPAVEEVLARKALVGQAMLLQAWLLLCSPPHASPPDPDSACLSLVEHGRCTLQHSLQQHPPAK